MPKQTFTILFASGLALVLVAPVSSAAGASNQVQKGELAKIGDYFEKEEKDFPRELMLMKAKCVRETIHSIEASTESPQLIRIK